MITIATALNDGVLTSSHHIGIEASRESYSRLNIGTSYILGHFLCVTGSYTDLRTENALDDILEKLIDVSYDDFRASLIDLVENKLPAISNWGDGEEDFEAALTHDEAKLRALLAMNGKYLEVLSQDEDSLVRIKVVQRMINEKGVVEHENIGWFDAMLDDKDPLVLAKLAEYGKQEFLDTLINHNSSFVQAAVAKFGTDAHCEILIKSPDRDVRLAVAERGYGALVLARDDDFFVRRAVAKHASVADIQKTELVCDIKSSVRYQLAKRGLYTIRLANDKKRYVSEKAREQQLLKIMALIQADHTA